MCFGKRFGASDFLELAFGNRTVRVGIIVHKVVTNSIGNGLSCGLIFVFQDPQHLGVRIWKLAQSFAASALLLHAVDFGDVLNPVSALDTEFRLVAFGNVGVICDVKWCCGTHLDIASGEGSLAILGEDFASCDGTVHLVGIIEMVGPGSGLVTGGIILVINVQWGHFGGGSAEG